jgi:ribosomal protein S18 acetylase RimI-like enzyme
MKPGHLAEVAAFVARLQADPTQHIGYFGEEAEETTVYIAQLEPAGMDGFVLAYDGDRLIGLFGVEADPEIGRAWLHGPLVDHADWHAVADQLYEAARQQVLPEYVTLEELLGDVANANLREFASRQGFAPLPDTAAVLRFRRAMGDNLPMASALDLTPEFHEAFIRLHERTFPGTYYMGKQIIAQLDDRHKAFIVAEDGALQGYLYGRIDTGGDGYIDFLGVEESARRRGIGRRLITAATRWLVSIPGVRQVALTVNGTNTPAIALYTYLGYEHLYTLQAHRKSVGQPP